jgi:hypothetical protein
MSINNMVLEKCHWVMCKVNVLKIRYKKILRANDYWWDLTKQFELVFKAKI